MNSQASLTEQIYALIKLANENGLYDAADWMQDKWLGPVQVCMNTWCDKGMHHRGNCRAGG